VSKSEPIYLKSSWNVLLRIFFERLYFRGRCPLNYDLGMQEYIIIAYLSAGGSLRPSLYASGNRPRDILHAQLAK